MSTIRSMLDLALLFLAVLAPIPIHGQTAEANDALIPVIAAIDIGGPSTRHLFVAWTNFRRNWPNRPFCLLRLEGATELYIPGNFRRDRNTIIANINRDGGGDLLRSDWFDQCNLDASSVRSVAFMLDIRMDIIQNSFDFFLERLGTASPAFDAPIMIADQDDNNWIQPLDVLILSSSMPSMSPSSTPSKIPTIAPSANPSATPSASPTKAPTGVPSKAPSGVPSLTPSSEPSANPSRGPTGVPSATPSSAPSTVSGTTASVTLAMTMFFPADNGIVVAGALDAIQLLQLDIALEDYCNEYFGSVLEDSQFIGTSATNAFTSQQLIGTGILYASTITATFRDSSITDSTMQAALANLNTVPLLFEIYSINNIRSNFAEIETATFATIFSAGS